MAGPGIGFRLVCQSGQIVHAGFQRQSQPLALLEGQVPFAILDFGIVTLVDTCEHLNLHLGIAQRFSELL